ncbi:MAG: alpha/beta fold hydrolase [Fuerstiella sp.]
MSSDGVRLYFRHWKPGNNIRGVVICLHGIQSHSGWYHYSSARMATAGYAVYFPDRRGSGLNGWQRGHADHGLRLLNDVAQIVRLARRETPALPVILLGLSWGGKLAAAFAVRHPDRLDGLVLLYPGLIPFLRPNPLQRLQLWFARNHDVRHRLIPIPLNDASLFTDDPKWQNFIDNDPLTLRSVTSGFLNAGLDLDRILRQPQQRMPPTLLMLAGQDRIVDNTATQQMVESCSIDHLSVISCPAAQHTLEFDSNRAAIFDDLIAWLATCVRSDQSE